MGKIYIDKKGYPRWRDNKKHVHISVMEKMIGHKIPKGYVVHHIDGNPRNFKRSNLKLMTRSAHYKHHHQLKKH